VVAVDFFSGHPQFSLLQQNPQKCSETRNRKNKCRKVAKCLEPYYQGQHHQGILPDAETLNIKISTNQHLTTMMTGHGNIKSYLYRFKIITSPTCPCGKNDQTTYHHLYECELLKTQRHSLKTAVSKSGGWPTSKNTLISKHYKSFKIFVNSIPFDNLG